jgi:hypothetical protein
LFRKAEVVKSRQAVALSTAALAVAALAGCSSSAKTGAAAATGSATPAASSVTSQAATNAGLTDAALLTAFKKATAQATAVHVSGSAKAGGTTITLDLQLNKTGNTASGTVDAGGTTVPFISVGGVTYIQFTDSVLKMSGASSNAAAAALLKNKWVSSKSSAGSSIASSFAGFASYDAFISGMTSDSGSMAVGNSTPIGTATYKGQTVAVYKGSDGSEASFAASGPAYLLQIASTNSTNSGTLTFTWNQPTTITAPPASQTYTG